MLFVKLRRLGAQYSSLKVVSATVTAKIIRGWLHRLGVKTLYGEPGSPQANGYIVSYNGKRRKELLSQEISDTPHEAKVLAEQDGWEYNTIRPDNALDYQPPAPQTRSPTSGSRCVKLAIQLTHRDKPWGLVIDT
jgi:transposase InsO family protein